MNQEINKRPFYQPGWYRNISDEEYHCSFGYSSSQIKKLLEKTPAHLKYDLTAQKEAKKHQDLGKVVHCLTLEKHEFDNKFIVQPDNLKKPTIRQINAKNPSDATLEQIEIWNKWIEKKGKKTAIDNKTLIQSKKMSENLGNFIADNIEIRSIIEGSINESSIYWWFEKIDPEDQTEYNFQAKVRPDSISTSHSILMDVKTCADATESGFRKAINNFYYDVSAAMYLYGVNQCKQLLDYVGHFAYTGFLFLLVESEPPYLPNYFMLHKDYLKEGRHLFQMGVKALQHGINDNWPGFSNEIKIIEPGRRFIHQI